MIVDPRRALIGLLGLTMVGATTASAQTTLRVGRQTNAVAVSSVGRGTLQAAGSVAGPWRDLVGVTNPFIVYRTNQAAAEFFRAISRYATRSNLLEANSEMSVTELNGEIYVLGGYPASRVTVGTVQVYNPAQNRWRRTTPLPLPVNHSMAASANGKLYIIGGQTTSSGTGSYVNNVYEYDPVSTNWVTRAPMPTARSAGAAAVIGNLIYVAGGRPPQGQDFAVYNAVSNQWTALPPVPTGRNHLAAAAIGGKVYVAGGRLDGGFNSEMTDVLEVFDPETNLWSARARLLIPRGGINGIAANGLFHIWGGEGPQGMFSQHDMYDPVADKWHRLEPLPTAVHGVTGAAFVNGWIYMPGGGTAVGGSSGSLIHQVYLPATNWVAF